MARYINADELIKHIPPEEPLSMFAVANAPTVDAVPIEFIQQWISELDDFISRYGGVSEYDSLTEHYIEYTKALNELMKKWIDHEQN